MNPTIQATVTLTDLSTELTFIQVLILLMLSSCLRVHPFCPMSLHKTWLKPLHQGLMGTQTAVQPRSTTHFITARDLHPDEVGDGRYHVGDVLQRQKKSLEHMNSLSFFVILPALKSTRPHLGGGGLQRDGYGDEPGAVLWRSERRAEEHRRGLGLNLPHLSFRA